MCLTDSFIDILLNNKQRDKKIETSLYVGQRKTLGVYKAQGFKISKKQCLRKIKYEFFKKNK